MRNTINFTGHSDLPVIGQGSWYMGENPSQHATEVAALQAGLECGLRLIDTAEMYADGAAEEVVGEALQGRRDQALVVSKVYPWNAGEQDAIGACERSLRTDYLIRHVGYATEELDAWIPGHNVTVMVVINFNLAAVQPDR